MSKTAFAILLLLSALTADARDIANDPPPNPADPLATPEGRFAHAIKIPNPLPANSGYRPGMTSKQYFDHLCRTAAGEFIFKTIEGVDGLVMLRPRPEITDEFLMDRHALEDPYGAVVGFTGKAEIYFVQPASGARYEFLEVLTPGSDPAANRGRFIRYYRDPSEANLRRRQQTYVNGELREVPYTVVDSVVEERKARFGYTWRGIVSRKQRALGIAGGELIVLDMRTGEVLAVRRGYIRSGDVRNTPSRIWWLGGHLCSNVPNTSEHQFIKQVLRPHGG